MSVPMRRTLPVSIEDVAEAAGVSTATVSRVLNNPALVAATTAARVQETIQKLGYKPNIFAKGLMTRRSRVLGIALPDISGEFYSELLRGADGEARNLGYHLLVSSEPQIHPADNRSNGSSLAFGLIDGLAVMITEPNEALLRYAMDASVPLVVLDAEIEGTGVDTIQVDNAVGTREATRHLLESVPPDRCYFVGGPRENFDTVARNTAFADMLKQAGHAIRPDQSAFDEYSVLWGERWAKEHLSPARTAPIGILCGNDEVAYGIMRTALDMGLDVPGHVRLIGFDDSRLASVVRPALTSVRMPAAEVGAAAITALVRRIDDPIAPPLKQRLASKLVIRQSGRP